VLLYAINHGIEKGYIVDTNEAWEVRLLNRYREIPSLLAAKRDLLRQLVDQLRQRPEVVALVLGGSYAASTQHAAADLDVGLYYNTILARPGSTAAELTQTVEQLTQSWRAVVALAGDLYQQKFQL
jgi:predicted nucleotidyltransferase